MDAESAPSWMKLRSGKKKLRFLFRPPQHVRLVGSYPLRLAARPDVCIDLALEMPRVSASSRRVVSWMSPRAR